MGKEKQTEKITLMFLATLPLLIAALIAWLLPSLGDHAAPQVRQLTEITARTPAELDQALLARDFHWPPEGPVPAVSVSHFPQGMNELSVDAMKSLFFRALLPLVLAENELIQNKRDAFQPIHERLNQDPEAELSDREWSLVEHLWERYRIDGDVREQAPRERLLRRMDIVPPSLALAQAANESGWGSSRFTRDANNLFGEWTWNPDQGMLPRQRAEGATHFVRIFPNLRGSVRSYVHNLNVGHAYGPLRQERARLREQGQAADGMALAQGLERYSERGQDYIREVQSMIRQNQLQELPEDLSLEPD